MKVSYQELVNVFEKVLLREGFPEKKAALCANIFAVNSRDGIHSHGLNRFPVFISHIREGLIVADAEPTFESAN